ncbi:hypothetical protein V6N13_100316 [Hibiscus sabdariffa]|uniref:Uncharacterized protein n=1 Tax=Hibiscus sabdariffa TaxID=183260 RepID=A0ABR2PCC1_9ROSI
MAGVCSALRDRCRNDHFWETHEAKMGLANSDGCGTLEYFQNGTGIRLILCLCVKDQIVKLSWGQASLLQLRLEMSRTRNKLRSYCLSMESKFLLDFI